MAQAESSTMTQTNGIAGIVERLARVVQWLAAPWLVKLILRLGLATPFFRSGILKWDGFAQVSSTAVYLFSEEFKLHLPGGPYSFPAPEVVAFLSGTGEVLLPILLVFGLGTRFAAFGLLVMTAVIQLTVPAAWPLHITWAAMALAIMALGPGRLSLDYLAVRLAGR
ncbi:MAG: DoxX family protein [Nitratireductor sp.]|nr:DoxX family protein [Nitratireductor sp.]